MKGEIRGFVVESWEIVVKTQRFGVDDEKRSSEFFRDEMEVRKEIFHIRDHSVALPVRRSRE